jgi:hypothetical protein
MRSLSLLPLLVLCLLPAPALAVDPVVADLLAAYPEQFAAIEGNDLVWRDGTLMAISDGIADKDFDTLLDHPDIDDMFVVPYLPGPPAEEPGLNQDPGRVRYEPLFTKMYGDCETGEVAPHLRDVAWLKGKVRFTTANGAADALERVVADLRKLPSEMTKYLVPDSGTYNCRRIAGTDRRSMHAYAAAIDINTDFTDYWLWSKPVDGLYPYRNRIPFAIAEIFERRGFIWGGKWYHYDTMHFEYRPELLPGTAAR